MGVYTTQRNATRNQSTADFQRKNVFTFGNRYQEARLVNDLGEEVTVKDGFLVCRNSGSYETVLLTISDALTAGQTFIIGGLTYTSTGATTILELVAAFSNLAVGATTGAGTATGTYSGALTGYSTGDALENDKVVFTASTLGPKTNLALTGTGAVNSGIDSIINGTLGDADGIRLATAQDINDDLVIGILKSDDIDLPDTEKIAVNYAISGDIDASLLILPDGVTLNSVVNSKTVKDLLTRLGFVLNNVTENSKFDN